ncbi:MAG: hypothetical protein IT279_07690 [Ignavibacteriaceae bacterium]|nr:hypothetical protein [Ignavibacteriaceae bacterium]
MEEKVNISIPGRKIKFRSKGINEAIKKLRRIARESKQAKIEIANRFFEKAKKGYVPNESDWYNQ